jgi:hypothetical protein
MVTRVEIVGKRVIKLLERRNIYTRHGGVTVCTCNTSTGEAKAGEWQV